MKRRQRGPRRKGKRSERLRCHCCCGFVLSHGASVCFSSLLFGSTRSARGSFVVVVLRGKVLNTELGSCLARPKGMPDLRVCRL